MPKYVIIFKRKGFENGIHCGNLIYIALPLIKNLDQQT
jgi:hypothetical protein